MGGPVLDMGGWMMASDRATVGVDEAAIERTVAALRGRNIEAVVAEDGAAALSLLQGMIPDGAEVFKSTSETLDTIGYSDYIRETDRYRNLYGELAAEADRERQRELRRLASVAEYYVGSVHAIAESGEVIIASGSGSQLGAYVFGAKQVIWVAGAQKICPTLEAALARVRGYAVERHHQWAEASGRPAGPMGKLLIFENEQQVGRVRLVLIREAVGW